MVRSGNRHRPSRAGPRVFEARQATRGVISMSEATGVVQRVQKWADMHRRGLLCDEEVANAFLVVALESEPEVAVESLAALPPPVRPLVRNMLSDLADRDWYDDRHCYICDGRTVAERQAHYRLMRLHYRFVGGVLLSWLGREPNN
jgi:hypothetical protein